MYGATRIGGIATIEEAAYRTQVEGDMGPLSSELTTGRREDSQRREGPLRGPSRAIQADGRPVISEQPKNAGIWHWR